MFKLLPITFKLLKESSRPKHPDAAPWVEHQQVLIPRYDDGGLGGERQLQIPVVLGIPAVLDLINRVKPECGRCQQLKNLVTPIRGQNPRKLRPRHNLADFVEDRI
ncbi:MAG TPA: hypothetical protein VGC82_07285 [Rhodopila sp.]